MSYTLTEWMQAIQANDQIRIIDQPPPDNPLALPNGCSEHQHQVALLSWARNHVDRYPALALLHAIPNGGQRGKAQAARLKAEGVLSGVPDLFLPAARRGFHGLYIELKVGSNKPSAEQRRVMEQLETAGYLCRVCWSAEAARLHMVWYLDNEEAHGNR